MKRARNGLPIVYHASQIDFSREELREAEEGSRAISARSTHARALISVGTADVYLLLTSSSPEVSSALYNALEEEPESLDCIPIGETDRSMDEDRRVPSIHAWRIRGLASTRSDLLAARFPSRGAALRKDLFLRRTWTGYALGARTRRFRRFYRAALAAGRLRSWNTYSRTLEIARGSHPGRGPPRGSALSRRRDRCHEWLRFQLPRLRRPPIVLNTFTASFDSKGLYRFGYFVPRRSSMAITRAVARIVETIGDTIRRLAILRLSQVYSIHSRISLKKRIGLAHGWLVQSRVDDFRLTNTRERFLADTLLQESA